MEKYTLTEEQIINLINIAREGSYYVDYSTSALPVAGKDYEFTVDELINEIKKGNI